jgi:hypothetical protein
MKKETKLTKFNKSTGLRFSGGFTNFSLLENFSTYSYMVIGVNIMIL